MSRRGFTFTHDNDEQVLVSHEDDGEGWFDCSGCGLHTGYLSYDNAIKGARAHDCEFERAMDEL